MAQQLHDLVTRAAPGERSAAMNADSLSAEIGSLVDAHAADISASHGLEFSAVSRDIGRGR